MSLNDIVYADPLRIAGDALNNSIIKYVRHKHKVTIEETTVEKFIQVVISPQGLPVEFTMTSAQVLSVLKESPSGAH